jgi:hypothetical protein
MHVEEACEILKQTTFDLKKTWRIHNISCYHTKEAMMISGHRKSDQSYMRYLIIQKQKWEKEKQHFQTFFRPSPFFHFTLMYHFYK